MSETPPPTRPEVTRWAVRAVVAGVGLLSLLPVADWIPGGEGTNIPPPIGSLYLLWAVGVAVLAGLSWAAARILPGARGADRPAPTGARAGGRRGGRRGAVAAPRPAGAEPAPTAPGAGGPAWLPAVLRPWVPWILVAVPALAYAATAQAVFHGRPLHVDAMTQAVQAHILADGALSAPAPEDPRFFTSALMAERDGRVFSQFPPGWAALLALGVLAGIPWMVAPLCGGLAVYGLYRLLREGGSGEGEALAAAALLGLSPWFAVNAASWMSHVPVLCFILVGSAALVRGMRAPAPALWSAAGGVGLGVATAIHPLEGVAFGLPATAWVLARGARDPAARRPLAAFAVGGAATVGLLLAYNQLQHGSPLLFGFELQWGPEHGLGFHEAPWGPPHTAVRGLELLNAYLLGLQLLYFDAPAPSLVLALGALLLARRLTALDRYLLAGAALVLLGYWAFWGEGHDLGPRYLVPLAPLVAVWTARFGTLLVERSGRPGDRRRAHAFVVLLVASGWILGTPNRWFVYARTDPLRRLDTAPLEDPRARDALVFLPSPWSEQVLSRLRSTGISRQEAQWLYYRVGLCKLDLALSRLEADGVREPGAVMEALRPLAADSARMVLDRVSGSPGDPFTGLTQADSAAVAVCGLRRYLEERQGGHMILTVQARLGPTWTGDGPIVAQDLHEENRRLLDAHPDRSPYFLKAVRIRRGVREFVLEPLKPDSAARVWEGFRRLQAEARVF